MRRPLAVCLGVGAALLILAGLLLTRSVPAPAAPPAQPFSGKTLFVQTREAGQSVTLEGPELRELGGRTFLVGREAKESVFTRNHFGTSTVWVPVDAIAQMVELP